MHTTTPGRPQSWHAPHSVNGSQGSYPRKRAQTSSRDISDLFTDLNPDKSPEHPAHSLHARERDDMPTRSGAHVNILKLKGKGYSSRDPYWCLWTLQRRTVWGTWTCKSFFKLEMSGVGGEAHWPGGRQTRKPGCSVRQMAAKRTLPQVGSHRPKLVLPSQKSGERQLRVAHSTLGKRERFSWQNATELSRSMPRALFWGFLVVVKEKQISLSCTRYRVPLASLHASVISVVISGCMHPQPEISFCTSNPSCLTHMSIMNMSVWDHQACAAHKSSPAQYYGPVMEPLQSVNPIERLKPRSISSTQHACIWPSRLTVHRSMYKPSSALALSQWNVPLTSHMLNWLHVYP